MMDGRLRASGENGLLSLNTAGGVGGGGDDRACHKAQPPPVKIARSESWRSNSGTCLIADKNNLNLKLQQRERERERERERGGLNIGLLWQLDGDDELHVVQSLLLLRVKKLGRLIGNIERVVNMNHWPTHEDRARDLRDRFTHAMLVINKELS